MRLILTEQVFPLQDSTSKLLSVAVSSKSFHDMFSSFVYVCNLKSDVCSDN